MLLNLASDFVELLQKEKINFCIVGGIAVLLHGGRASTIDFDCYLLVSDLDKLEKVCQKNKLKLESLGEHQKRISFKKLRIDILLADEELGQKVIARAQKIKLGKSRAPVASVEDLIVMKTLSDRPIDRRDVEELREIFSDSLDATYVEEELARLKALL